MSSKYRALCTLMWAALRRYRASKAQSVNSLSQAAEETPRPPRARGFYFVLDECHWAFRPK